MTSRAFSWCRLQRSILGTVAALAVGGSYAVGATLPEDLFPELGGILRDAVTQSPRMLDQNLQRLQAEQQILVTSSRLLPQVNLGVTYNLQYEDRSTTSDDFEFNNRYNAGFSVSYPLLHWGAVRTEADIGKLQAEIAADNIVIAYRQLALEIRRTYLQATLDRVAVRNARLADEIVRRRLEVLQVQVDARQAPEAALGDARLSVEESALALERTTRTLDSTVRTLRRLTGRAGLTAESIPVEVPAIKPISMDETAAQGSDYLAQRRFLDDGRFTTASDDLRNEKRRLHVVSVNQRPKVDLVTGVSLDQLSYVSDIGQRTGVTAAYVGVRVNWNIFDGYNTRGRKLMTQTRVQQLENRLTELEEDLRFAASQAATDVALAARALAIAEGRFNGAQGSFKLTSENFERQRATADDVERARMGVNDWELRMFAARVTYLNAVAAWMYSINADPVVPATIASPNS